MSRIVLFGAAVPLISACLAIWQYSQSVEVGASPIGFESRKETLKEIRADLEALSRKHEKTRRVVLANLEIQKYVNRYKVDRRLAALIYSTATINGFKPDLIFRVVKVESNFRNRAVSPTGAVGLMQIMPATGSRYGVNRTLLFDSEINLRVGVLHLRNCFLVENEDLLRALDRYKRGNRPDSRHKYANEVLQGLVLD